jgi:predicted transcriptional regulator
MQFERLTETEKITLVWLSEEDNPLTITQILNKGSISRSELSNTLQSLLRRFLVEKQEDGEIYFTISPIIKEYCLIV